MIFVRTWPKITFSPSRSCYACSTLPHTWSRILKGSDIPNECSKISTKSICMFIVHWFLGSLVYWFIRSTVHCQFIFGSSVWNRRMVQWRTNPRLYAQRLFFVVLHCTPSRSQFSLPFFHASSRRCRSGFIGSLVHRLVVKVKLAVPCRTQVGLVPKCHFSLHNDADKRRFRCWRAL